MNFNLISKKVGPAAFQSLNGLPGPVKVATMPAPSEVRVTVKAVSINLVDYKRREGIPKTGDSWDLPISICHDVDGVVDAVGANVTSVQVGDHIAACSTEAVVYAQAADVTEDGLVRIPDSMSFTEAAAVWHSGMSALQALRTAGIKEGDAVFISGGAREVGRFAIQLAKYHFHASKVVATCHETNAPFCKSLGADETVDPAKDSIYEGQFDVVFDTVGEARAMSGLPKEGGKVVSVATLDSAPALNEDSFAIRSYLRVISAPGRELVNRADLQLLFNLVENKTIHVESEPASAAQRTRGAMTTTLSTSSLPELGSTRSPSPRSPGLPPVVPSTPRTDVAQTPTRTGSSASVLSLWAASSPIRKTVSLSSLSRKMRSKHGRPPLPDLVAAHVVAVTKPCAPAVDTRLINVLEDAVACLDRLNSAAERNQAWVRSTRAHERALEQVACLGVATAVSSSAALAFHLSAVASLALMCCSLALAMAGVARRRQHGAESLPAPLVDDIAGLRRQLDDQVNKCRRALDDDEDNDDDDDDDDIVTLESPRAVFDAGFADDAARLRGMTFNCFSNIPTLKFERDVLARLDDAQQAAFHEFTEKFDRHLASLGALRDDQVPDAYNRLRFLQADQYKVDEAIARLSRTVLWRKDHLDAFVVNPNQSLLRRCRGLRPRVWCGFDRHGKPLMFEKLGLFFGSDEAYKGMSM